MDKKERIVELPMLFKKLIKEMSHEWKKRMDSNLSITQFRMIYILCEIGPQKAVELAGKLSVTPGAVTGLADKLIEKGLIVKEQDAHDRRSVRLRLTEEGKNLIDSMMEQQKEMINLLFESLPEEDIEHLNRIFKHMLDRIKTTEEE